ncbi:GDSL-type esterase/lipase family protein [Flavobacterium sp. ASW18X]|uniref:GDSL-type esterase/lipase family protein n=1 Tax=Flavobacterium sp. ASW18X TaxID=2572595 RepID=UPI0010AEAE5F|nr:GDSL-type esterase/lipase family protein [Flavobacterium sp. ASW18X]TKD62392.1 G-D-S-L family lipolytic protein [Flavobacterium sp. ASW18X]
MLNKFYLFISLLCVIGSTNAQDVFKDEITALVKHNDSLWNQEKATVIFTGSSSIRMWKNLKECFPEHQVLNTGFGGSQTSDLLHYLDDVVLRYHPKKVFIYEGDNDISAKKRPKEIIVTLQEVLERLYKYDPDLEVVLISTKPSIARWKLKGKYKRLNKKLDKLAKNSPNISYADVWYAMLDGKKLRKDIFIADGLHMNPTGYDIWHQQLKQFLY